MKAKAIRIRVYVPTDTALPLGYNEMAVTVNMMENVGCNIKYKFVIRADTAPIYLYFYYT